MKGESLAFGDIMGKIAAALGTTMIGITALLTDNTHAGMLSILVLFIGGAVLLVHARPPRPSRGHAA